MVASGSDQKQLLVALRIPGRRFNRWRYEMKSCGSIGMYRIVSPGFLSKNYPCANFPSTIRQMPSGLDSFSSSGSAASGEFW